MYLLLSRALTNLGDFLIFERGKELIKAIKKNEELIYGKAWIPLNQQFSSEELRNLKAVIIPGGPGVRTDMYPHIYPLSDEIFQYNIPVIFLGIGSKFFPGNSYTLNSQKLDQSSLEFCKYIEKKGKNIGVRDELTQDLLLHNNISNVSFNGCPAWYDLDMFGKPMEVPSNINKILFSPPVNPKYFYQTKQILKKLSLKYPNTKISLAFHAGIKENKTKIGKFNQKIVSFSQKYNFEIIDAKADLKILDYYDSFDIHIGYRVHAHIFFLSHRKPSFLIAEDSRGSGVLQSLGGVGFPAWSKLINILSKYHIFRKIIRVFYNRNYLSIIKPSIFAKNNLNKVIILALTDEINSKFKHYQEIPQRIEKTFIKMKSFIEKIP